jgi:hypothetical protein
VSIADIDVSMQRRRFPPPWSVEEQPACFVVRDHGGHGPVGQLENAATTGPFLAIQGLRNSSGQLGDIGRNPSRFIGTQQLCR